MTRKMKKSRLPRKLDFSQLEKKNKQSERFELLLRFLKNSKILTKNWKNAGLR